MHILGNGSYRLSVHFGKHPYTRTLHSSTTAMITSINWWSDGRITFEGLNLKRMFRSIFFAPRKSKNIQWKRAARISMCLTSFSCIVAFDHIRDASAEAPHIYVYISGIFLKSQAFNKKSSTNTFSHQSRSWTMSVLTMWFWNWIHLFRGRFNELYALCD